MILYENIIKIYLLIAENKPSQYNDKSSLINILHIKILTDNKIL